MALVHAATDTKIASQLDLKTQLLDARRTQFPPRTLGTARWEGEVVGILRQRLAKGPTAGITFSDVILASLKLFYFRLELPSESSEEEERYLEALEWVRPSAGCSDAPHAHPSD